MRIPRLLLVLAALSLWAGPLSQGDRDYALSQLHASRKLLLDAIAGLTEAQWKFKPAEDRWSIAQIAEHLVLSEDMIRDYVKKVMATPAVPQKFRREQDEKSYALWLDRTEKFKAPKELQPAGKLAPADAAREFAARRDRTLEYVRTTQGDLRAHISGSGAQESDAYQVLLGIAAHTERHVAQLNEVKAAPGYPK
jgi:hypothetical protein